MRLEDAASKLQANIKGYLLRKDFYRFNRISEILYKFIGKILEKETPEYALHKWRKNARLIQCEENSKIIQEFCRRNLDKYLKGAAERDLHDLFKRYIYKLIAKMLKTKTINPEDIDNFYHTVRRVFCREPFDKLIKGLRWKMI